MVYVSYISGKLETGEMRALGALRKGKELEKASWRRGNWSWVCLKMSGPLGQKRHEIRRSQTDKSWETGELIGDKGGGSSGNWWVIRAV